MLRVTTELYDDEDLSASLLRRLERGEPIGQSIGGWFTELQVVQNSDGEVERVIVQGVELDHLAVTRAPANPDSIGLVSLRSKLQADYNERHVIDVEPRDDGTVAVVFAMHHDEDEAEAEDEEAVDCLLYTSPSPRDKRQSRMPSSA